MLNRREFLRTGLLGVAALAVPAVARSAIVTANIIDYGADPTGAVSCDAALAAAQAASDSVVVPAGLFKIATTFNFASGKIWSFLGGEFVGAGDTYPLFKAQDIERLSLLGDLRCKGHLVSDADTGEAAIVFENVNRCYAERISARLFKGDAVRLSGTNAGPARGDTLTIVSLGLYQNHRGLNVVPGSGAEYCTIGAIEIAGNIYGATIGAGNTRILGGNVVDNYYGIELVAGTNHGHGVLANLGMNHNQNWNLRASDVEYGFTISGCHFYGSPGRIELSNSAGVTISDGILDCEVNVVGPNVNSLRNNFVGGSATITGAGAANLIRAGNYNSAGLWSQNNY